MLRIRLRRMGNRNRPFYRVVVSDSRKTPTASAVEEVGHYNPTSNPPRVRIDAERVRHWMGVGARPSPTVLKLLKAQESGRAPEKVEPEPEEVVEAAPAAEAAETAEPAAAAETPEPAEAAEGTETPEAPAS